MATAGFWGTRGRYRHSRRPISAGGTLLRASPTGAPAWRAPESTERRPYTMSGAALVHDDSRMLSAFTSAQFLPPASHP
jgi:hypothetical protein